MVHAVTAVTPSSREKWSLLWDARTTPSALSAVFAGMYIPSQNTHTILYTSMYSDDVYVHPKD